MKSNSFILLQNYIMSSNAVGFEIEIGLGENELNGLVKKPLDVNKLNKISVCLYNSADALFQWRPLSLRNR